MIQTMHFPDIQTLGTDGLLVRFGDSLSEPANRAALAFGAALERDLPEGVEEVATSLVSVFVRFDVRHLRHADLRSDLAKRLKAQDWFAAEMPVGRRLITIPTVYGGSYGPQLAKAAGLAGLSEDAAIKDLSEADLRITAVGFAPGQPYLGFLPDHWDIPRNAELAPVPTGAVVAAVRQIVLFSVDSPTGWNHVGQTAFRAFQPDHPDPFRLRPGDEIRFTSVTPEEYEALKSAPDGGAAWGQVE